MTTAIKNEIKSIVRQSVRDVLMEELPAFRAMFIGAISDSENREILKKYRKPDSKAVRTIRVRV